MVGFHWTLDSHGDSCSHLVGALLSCKGTRGFQFLNHPVTKTTLFSKQKPACTPVSTSPRAAMLQMMQPMLEMHQGPGGATGAPRGCRLQLSAAARCHVWISMLGECHKNRTSSVVSGEEKLIYFALRTQRRFS